MLKPLQQSLLHRIALTSCLSAFVVQFTSSNASAQETAARLLRTDSRAGYLHKLTLYDRDGQAINPEDKNPKPYSPKITCGKCHEYGLINHGWHFNAGLPEEPLAESSIQNPNSKIQNPTSNPQSQPSFPSPGRPGEPWIFTDPDTGTQIPLSYRDWPGTFRPADIGLTPWKFVQTFGRHLPGGGIFDPDPKTAAAQPEAARWKISGGLEIDCMVCHAGAGSGYDAGEIARQVARENLAWIPTAALGLGVIRGDAKKVPDDFDPDAIMAPDQTGAKLPEVAYNKALFDADQRVYFDIVNDPPAERCYFCHSARDVGPTATKRWEHEGDVHLAAGLRCSDCHANGIDHATARGFFTTGFETDATAALTCEGCHLGLTHATDPAVNLGGRFRAPRPQHAGIPPLHFDHLTCTTCHSGSWPDDSPQRIQTSLAHSLGVSTKERREDEFPNIFEPTYFDPFLTTRKIVSPYQETDRPIVPARLLWPAYWAKRFDGKLTPLPLDAAQKAAKKILQRAKKKSDAHGPLTDDEITLLLKSLTKAAPAGGREPAPGSASTKSTPSTKSTVESSKDQVVYLRDGNFYTLADGDKLNRETLATERPYLWPLAHDVRPARQALGARGCTDCHAENTPIFTGKLAATAQIPGTPLPIASMDQLIGYDPNLAALWARSFQGRTLFKWFAFTCLAIATFAFLRRAILGGAAFIESPPPIATKRPMPSRWFIGPFVAVILFGTVTEYLTGRSGLSGRWLWWHMVAAPFFLLWFTLIAIGIGWPRKEPGSGLYNQIWLWIRALPSITEFPILARLSRACFFIAICSGLLMIGSILAAMLPVFGYESQRVLIRLHNQSSGLSFVACTLGWLFAVIFPLLVEQSRARKPKSP